MFVCSRNQWRSPTGEAVFSRVPQLSVKSRGTSPNARQSITHKDIVWADVIFVMERKHKSWLNAKFARAMQFKPIHVLDILDDFAYMDPELVKTFEKVVPPLLP